MSSVTHQPIHPPIQPHAPTQHNRKLAVVWHPDKHPNNQEEAKAKFQAISQAYTSLMATSEDDKVEQLEQRGQ